MIRRLITVEKNINRERYNPVFILLVVLISGIGIAVLYSGSLHYAERFFGNPSYFVIRQIRNLVIGSVGLIFFTFFDIERLRKILPYL